MTIQEEPTSRLYEDEIDLRRYVEILFTWWREILFLTILLPILTAIALLLWQIIGPSTYTARATVVIARTDRSTIVDERLETIVANYSAEYTNALVGLVYSGSIAQDVISDLNDLLSEDELKPALLLENVTAVSRNALPNISGNSDLIAIMTKADSPVKAASIANSWATNYVDHVYDVYGQVPAQLLDTMQAELDNAEGDYQRLQTELTEFVAGSPMLMLERQITSTLTIADSLIALQGDAAVNQLTSQSSQQDAAVTVFVTADDQNALDQVDNRLRSLQAELEAQQATHQVLSEKRDIAWDAWKTLKKQIDEMSIDQLSTRGQVRLASAAVPPEEPDSLISLSSIVPLAALVGLLFGIFVAIFGEFMGRRPFLAK